MNEGDDNSCYDVFPYEIGTIRDEEGKYIRCGRGDCKKISTYVKEGLRFHIFLCKSCAEEELGWLE